MSILNKFNDGAAKLEKILLVIMLAVMLILGILQVFARFILQSPISWSEALLTYMFIWCSYIGAALGIYTVDHFRIDALVNMLPPKAQKVIGAVVCLVIIGFSIFIIRYGFKLALSNRTRPFPPFLSA
jgi:TRAP-type C4-dicarboxylate transport system permease small subunit